MALLVSSNKTYYKIDSYTVDYSTNDSYIKFHTYNSKEQRDLEKEIKFSAIQLKYYIRDTVDNLVYKAEKELLDLKETLNIESDEEFLTYIQNNELELYNQLLKAYELREEFALIHNHWLITYLDINTLKNKEYWIGLGVKQEYLNAVESNSYITFRFDHIYNADLTTLYTEAKKRFEKVEDC